uniref:UPAR/Ly6 domain-containing protein n=1 Tax=Leptobrachium leishanense TaxID=445787 RepID=A0A8C5WJB0_9ANUR
MLSCQIQFYSCTFAFLQLNCITLTGSIQDTTTTVPISDTTDSELLSSLSCIECVNATGSSCPGSSVICPEGNVCGSHYTVTETGGSVSVTVSRKCLPENQCRSSGSYSFVNVKIKTATSCCNTNNCNPSLPQWSSRSSEPNGVTCPSCSSPGSVVCYSGETMQCTGNENICFMRSSTIAESQLPSSVRGCGTQNICNAEFKSTSPGLTNVLFFCRNKVSDQRMPKCSPLM